MITAHRAAVLARLQGWTCLRLRGHKFDPAREAGWLGYRSGRATRERLLRVVIYMYWNEKDHPVPHFHAYHSGHRASVSADGVVLAGGLEHRALLLTQEWASLHWAEIVANWKRARKSEPLLSFPPLP